jgi:glycosyltransferase involved in cell wall biosynthesis
VFILVGGDAKDLREIATRHTALLREGALRLVLRQSRDSIPAYLAMAEVMVSPRAWGSNLPLKVFDYLAAGKPIVATDIPAHRPSLDESRALLTGPSATELASGIMAILQDSNLARDLGEAAGRYARQELGWLSFAQSVAHLYRRVEARSRPERSSEH